MSDISIRHDPFADFVQFARTAHNSTRELIAPFIDRFYPSDREQERQNSVTLCIEPRPDRWSAKLHSFRNLVRGWNGYDAPVPSERAFASADAFLAALRRVGLDPSRLAPSVVGGIGITLRKGNRKVYFEFYNTGRVCALFSDGEADPQVDDVQSDCSGYDSILTKARGYLDG